MLAPSPTHILYVSFLCGKSKNGINFGQVELDAQYNYSTSQILKIQSLKRIYVNEKYQKSMFSKLKIELKMPTWGFLT